MQVSGVRMLAGFAIIPQCTFDRCSVRHLGSQAVPTADSHFHLCTDSTDEVQSLVSESA